MPSEDRENYHLINALLEFLEESLGSPREENMTLDERFALVSALVAERNLIWNLYTEMIGNK